MKKTSIKLIVLTITAFMLVGSILAQDTTVVSQNSDEAVGLDLNAVAEVFKDSDNLEEFEKNLNDEDKGINNLDLDENGEVDYLRVMENVADDTRLIVVQSALGENQYQDVATIAVEKESSNYNMQIHGSPVIYGTNYYIVPRYTNLRTWRLINWIYRPAYRPYRSVFGWRVYPRWWRVRRPVTYRVYRTRTVRFVGKRNFTTSRTVRVKTVRKVRYNPRTSTLVKRKKVVRRTNGNTVVKKKGVKTTTYTNANGKTVTKKKGVKVKKNKKTGKKTVVKGKKKTAKTKKGKKTVKKVKKKKN